MEMVLTGDFMKAEEALTRGLVSRVVPAEKSMDEAVELAKKIAAMPRLICNSKQLFSSYCLQGSC